MSHKREQAQHAPGRVTAQVRTAAAEPAQARAAAEPAQEKDVTPWLRQLGFRSDEAKRAALRCETIPEASLEERVRFALSFLSPPHRRAGNLVTAT